MRAVIFVSALFISSAMRPGFLPEGVASYLVAITSFLFVLDLAEFYLKYMERK